MAAQIEVSLSPMAERMPRGLPMRNQPDYYMRKALLMQIRRTGVKSYQKDRFVPQAFVVLGLLAEEGVLERVSEDHKQATYRLVRDPDSDEVSSLAS